MALPDNFDEFIYDLFIQIVKQCETGEINSDAIRYTAALLVQSSVAVGSNCRLHTKEDVFELITSLAKEALEECDDGNQ